VVCTNNILVVDPEPTIVDMLVEILADEGYIAYSAPDGAGALAAIARHPPALLMLDVRMPGLHGAELITQVCEVGPATMPIVLMSTARCDAAPQLTPRLFECLPKPFYIEDLLACVARYVQPLAALAAASS
jgi:DNA-binding NtrC family response regulator